ncbi:alpha-L-fucosidase [Flagellimonas sp. CMM7]|uniref:alpha-L-fucosidase n=1 Tax=Flagellimonas sp. CMM7 TaxID=2654676 RepID=UPI0013CF9477|nr:alpha-L-fucosidase [Flagellimonas sp. CMM7]UII78740.1 alpha-L-fucosidase [Flagellimonas sp. CMM7]
MRNYKILTICLLCFFLISTTAQEKKIWDETKEEKEERLAWWRNDRFGMFIHWGTYSLAARHEHLQKRDRINSEDYQKYFDHFNPDLYNPKEWAKLAKAAGMKYAVITSKHHEGFTLFDSKLTEFKVTNTPYGKDALKEFVDAFREEGLKIGFYYSVIDWNHPEYTIDNRHPLRPIDVNDIKAYKALNKDRDMAKYREYMKNQVTEILTNYGKLDILWLDFSFPGETGKDKDDWGSVELVKLVRKLQPEIIINDRLDIVDYEGGWDFTTPEQFKVEEWPRRNGKKIPWETCQTFSGSWGYYRDEMTWKNNRQLLGLLIESVSKGGNLLLNVGPTGRGEIDYRAEDALVQMGDWMKYNSESIYGCTEAPKEFKAPDNAVLTYNPTTNRLYIHFFEYPLQKVTLKDMKGKIEYVQFLHDASEILVQETRKPNYMTFYLNGKKQNNDVDLILPIAKPPVEIPVVEIFLK